MSTGVDLSALEWGSPPVSLLPRTLREAWASCLLPDWVAQDLSLRAGATASDLGNEFAYSDGAEARVRHFIRTFVAQRVDEVRKLRCFDFAPPNGFQLSLVPYGTRSWHSLERAGLTDNPTGLFAATFGELLQISGLGVATLIEMVSLTEGAALLFSGIVARPAGFLPLRPPPMPPTPTSPAETLPDTWRADCERVLSWPWVDKVSCDDPRFSPLLPAGSGTLEDRLLAVLADPLEAARKAPSLLKALPAVKERVAQIEPLSLDDGLANYLTSAFPNKPERVALLGMRLGWLGPPPRTLQECGEAFGITRERVRQLEKKLRDGMPLHAIIMPRLEEALEALEAVAPIEDRAAEALLAAKGICGSTFSIESVLAAAADLKKHTTLSFATINGRTCVSTAAQEATLGALLRKARNIAGANGVASVYQLFSALSADEAPEAQEATEEAIRKTLAAWPTCCFVNDDWFTFNDLPAGRNCVINVLDRMLSVSPRLTVSDAREGIRRRMRFRNLSQGGTQVAPPTSVLESYLTGHPDYLVQGGHVSAKLPRRPEDELGDTERAMLEVFEEAGGGVLDRRSFVEGCIRKGLNENTVSVYSTYSPVIEHVGVDLWKLRGRVVDAARVEAVRQSNQERSQERRCIHSGWTAHGTLLIAWTVPWQFNSIVFGVPRAVAQYLKGQTFSARGKSGTVNCGKVSVNDEGASYGYSQFLRQVSAEEGDVITADFDIAAASVELDLSDVQTVLDTYGDGQYDD
jgi:hypothetical protein